MPWNLKGRRTLSLSPLNSSCVCFTLSLANRLSQFLKTTGEIWPPWICILQFQSNRQSGLALFAPIPNSWEKRSYWLSFAYDSSSGPMSYDQRTCSAVEMWAQKPSTRDSEASSQRRGKPPGTWQTLSKISTIIIFTNEAQHIFHCKWVFERIINVRFPWHAN